VDSVSSPSFETARKARIETPEALSGAGDVCGMIEELARDVRKSIPVEALDAHVEPPRESR
jgi:hypothetical protein